MLFKKTESYNMKIFKKVVLIFIFLIAILAISIFGYLQYSKPKYEGKISIKNLSKTTDVYYDEYGIPHIYAANQKDAFLALGYVHAQDRLWQMELLRRIAPGRLSEVFGSVALENDKFFAGIGINESSEKAIAGLDKNSETYQFTAAYLDGINQYLENGKTPIEYTILGLKKEKFTIKDVYNTFGYMAFSFAMAERTDPLLSSLKNKLDLKYLNELGIKSEFNTTKIKNHQGNFEEYATISKAITQLMGKSFAPPFIGSNSWVLAPEKTKNKKVIFENDPHIGFSQPCTWFEAHLVCPEYETYGYFLAGTPFPLLAHNREYAYGLTMFENDDLDFFQETINPENPNQYKTVDGYKNFETTTKTIKVKDTLSVKLNIKKSIHGPIMNGLINNIKSKNPVAMSWIYTQQKNQSIEAVYKLSHAKNANDFYANIALISSPGLNIMYGDAKGNIAWITSGKLYKVPTSVNPNLILDGANGVDDKKEFINFSKNPHSINPPWNYVATANNQPEAVDGYLYPGYYLPENRSSRIKSLLESKNNWTKEEVANMSLDNVAEIDKKVVANWLQYLEINSKSDKEKQAITILKNWNGSTAIDQIAPTIYAKWLSFYFENTFEDEMGTSEFETFLSTHLAKQIIANQGLNENSIWWDNVATKSIKETKKDIINKAFKQAISSLEKQFGSDNAKWVWGNFHTLEHEHPLGEVAVLKSFFNVGPYKIAGANEVINNMIFGYESYENANVQAGPSTRRIIDFSDIENSWSILPTGNSGNPMSKHYNDQAQMYADGKFRKMKMNKKEIVATSRKLVFRPK